MAADDRHDVDALTLVPEADGAGLTVDTTGAAYTRERG